MGDRWGMAYSLNDLGNVAYLLGDYVQAKALHGEGLAISREIGDLRCPLLALDDMGNAAVALGEYADARRLYVEGLALARAFGAQWLIGTYLHELGYVAYVVGEREEAKRLLQESLTLHRDTGFRTGIAACLNTLAHVAFSEAEYWSGKQLLQESMTIREDFGDRRGIAACLCCLGNIATALGAYQEAERYLHEALMIAMDVSAVARALDVLVGMAALLMKEGAIESAVHQVAAPGQPPMPASSLEMAVRLLTVVLRHQASEKATRDRAEDLRAALASQLPAECMTTAWQRAGSRTLDEVAQELLGRPQFAQRSSAMSTAARAAASVPSG
jgi:tetratricopeptide (TPR) repeat protein